MKKIVDLAPGLKAQIEQHRREDDPAMLAVDLAEAYTNATNFQRDVEAFSAQADDDRAKAREYQGILRQLKAGGDRKDLATINPKTGQPRRMDPIMEWDEGSIANEIEMRKNRSNEFRQKANECKNKVVAARRDIDRLNKAIKAAQERVKAERAAEIAAGMH